MDRILFYEDKKGNQPAAEYIRKLSKKKDKDSRIKFNKIIDYLQVLEEYGFSAGEPFIKHIEDEIWELRPLRDRFFFVSWLDNKFIILHSFMKDTRKTPRREIEKAKREYADILERREEYE